MNLILYNGRIRTMDAHNPEVSAIAIADGRIASCGDDAAILALRTPQTALVDLGGARAVPGFNDSHLHLLHHSFFAGQCQLLGSASIDEIVGRLKTHIEKKRLPAGSWVGGLAWNQDLLAEQRYPTRQDLDRVSTEHPIVCFRTCLHIAAVNSAALAMLGLDHNSPPIPGGEFDVETGIFKEAGTYVLVDALTPGSVDEIKGYLLDVGEELRRCGITSVQSDDFSFAKNHRDVVRAYTELAREKKLPFRVYQQCRPPHEDQLDVFLAEQPDLSGAEHRYALGPVKLMGDGSLGARTAYLRKPYHDDPTTHGLPTYTQQQLDDLVWRIHDAGRAVAIHAIGDGAIAMAIESIRKAKQRKPVDIRHGIVHCQITDRALLDAFRALDILAYVQPIFFHADVHVADARVGTELAATSYNYKTMITDGVHLSLGTDCPVESLNPLPNLYSAVTRKDLNGRPPEGFYPDQCLTVDEAVYAYTAGSAYCSGEEDLKGILRPGALADIAVLSDDIYAMDPMKIKDVTVDMTVFDGEIVWRR